MQNNINLCESNKELDNLILDFLLFGAPLGEKYFYDKNIKQELINYFNEPRLSYKKEGGEIIHDIDTLLHNYINENFKIIKGTDKIGILLSGGIDSANILSYLSKYQYNIFAYTWGGWGPKSTDVLFSKLSAKKFNVANHKLVFLDYDYQNQIKLFIEALKMLKLPLIFSVSIPYLKMLEEIKKDKINYIYNGQNADTLFLAYPAPILTFKYLKIFNYLRISNYFNFFNPIFFMTRFKSSGTNKYIKISNDYKIRLKNFWKPISNLVATFQQKIILMEEIYTEAPSCQNHQKKLLEFFGLKVLNPYYDPDFIKYTISLSDCWRQKNNYSKYLLYKLAEKNGVPREVIEKEKKGLSYGFTHFIQNKYHLRIWNEILANKLLSKYIDIELAFKKEKDNFFLFDRLMSAHYFIKYVLNRE